MAKLLFVPTTTRLVEQLSLVRQELDKDPDYKILAIALDRNLEVTLKRRGFSYSIITDYHTSNMLKIMQEEKPDLLITYGVSGSAKGLIYAADCMDIPTLMMDDGLTGDPASSKISKEMLLWKIMRWLKGKRKFRNYWPLLVTLRATNSPWRLLINAAKEGLRFFRFSLNYISGVNIAVTSPHAKRMYIKMGVDPEHIFVTGQPRFDQIRQKKFDREYIKKELDIPKNKRILVLATQAIIGSFWTEKEREWFLETVVSTMDEFPEEQLVIKLHPGEKMEEYKKILTEIGHNQAIICQGIDLYQLLQASDLLMTIHSTVALEAMILDKPVITINLSGRPDQFPFAKSGAAIGVYSERELAPAIRKALYDLEARKELAKKRKEFVQEHAYKQDGQASKRVAELIIRLINDSKKNRKGVLI